MSKEKFRVYESYAESMADRAKFLAENRRYEKAGLYDPGVKGDLEKEAAALAKAGYATDKNYAEKIIDTARGPTMRAGIALATGKPPEAHDHDGLIRKGDRGDAVHSLQTSLAALGYADAHGKALTADSDFGPGTEFALKAFQREHGLQDDGLAGKATLAAISEATAVQRDSRRDVPSMLDTRHPANGFYEQAFRCVSQLDKDYQRETGPHSQMLSGSLVSAATAAGFNRIDHVFLSDDASQAYAVQGDLKSPFKQYANVDVVQAIQTPLSQSSAEAAIHIQANEQSHNKQSQQQTMQQQAQEVQSQVQNLQR